MPSLKCPYCSSVFKWDTDVGEGRAECPMCGKSPDGSPEWRYDVAGWVHTHYLPFDYYAHRKED